MNDAGVVSAVVSAVVIGAVSFLALSLVEKLIHKLTHNPDKSYRWGVWVFSLLIGLYAFVTNLGR
ncbi:MAG TPA: hypothetical protein VK963_02175 [Candidatus Saccharimonadales bacterium]|nr:hypothetical protein [Candidatus Saccharimonadales bacterium]